MADQRKSLSVYPARPVKLFCVYSFMEAFHQMKSFERKMKEWKVDDLPDVTDKTSIKFCSSWSVNVLAISSQLFLSGCLKGIFGQSQKLTLSDEIKQVSCNDSFCLILLKNGNCYKLPYETLELCELNFIGVCGNSSLNSNKDTFPSENSNRNVIEHIACGQTLSVAVTNTNAVYNIPSRIYEFPKHVKVKKVSCGAEHALILTSNGDVYSWGSSSRGQLGVGQLDSEVKPTLIEGLAGLKITDVSCGLWHSAAVSAFGDLYMWGWNLNGQLGKPVYKNVKINYENGRSDMVRHKDVSVFASPEIVDLPKVQNDEDANDGDECCLENHFFIERVHCGSRHTVIETKCEKILVSGFNRYGQLNKNADQNIDHNIVKFVEMDHNFKKPFYVKCGSWCTVLISE